jgi:hypothetical protein
LASDAVPANTNPENANSVTNVNFLTKYRIVISFNDDHLDQSEESGGLDSKSILKFKGSSLALVEIASYDSLRPVELTSSLIKTILFISVIFLV